MAQYQKQLFEDCIRAHQYGPVVDSVFSVYKGQKTLIRRADMPAIRSRILFAKDGVEKLKSIDSTIEKYGKLSAHRLRLSFRLAFIIMRDFKMN